MKGVEKPQKEWENHKTNIKRKKEQVLDGYKYDK